LAKYVTNSINEDFGTDLLIQKVDLSFLGTVQLKGIEIRDHHKDTLIFVNKLSTSILNIKKILDGDVKLKSISIEDAHFYMKTYKNETDDNLAVFIDSFDSEIPKDSLKKPFTLETSNIYLSNLKYKLTDDNDEKPIKYIALNAGGNLQDFSIVGPDVKANIRGLYFKESNGLNVTNLTTNFMYSLSEMNFQKTTLETSNSKIEGAITFTYDRKDLKDFNNKVNIKANFKKSTFSIRDLKKFYGELSGDDELSFTGNATGTLNDLKIQNLNLNSKNGLKVYGDLSIVNSINTDKAFLFKGDLEKVSATYADLKNMLPNVLGKTLPSELSKLGRFDLKGLVRVTSDEVVATINLNSEIGTISSDFQISNWSNTDFTTYWAGVGLKNFDLGLFLGNPLYDKISLNGRVNGRGFKLESLNTSFEGAISAFGFKKYTYTNIKVDGAYKNNKFDGNLLIDDEHFKMNFKGFADLSSAVHKFDFDADVASLDLKQTNLFTRDSIALLKGKILLDVAGNTFEDIIANATFNNVYYTNHEKEFCFEQFRVSSSIKEDVKRIEVVSKDIANGYLSGKFTFSELLPVAQNALGSIYTNYKPYKVAENQFLDFNFTLYNQIVKVFFPEINIHDKTKIKGKVTSNKQQLKLNITSPRIEAFGTEIKDIKLLTDNQNPLYNTSLTASELNTKYYKLSKLNLLNRTDNDTLYFKSVFEGGKFNNEEFNLDFYFTINPKGKSVVAFQESSFNFKENIWKINPNKQNTDKITFDINTNEFDFSQFKITSEAQKIEFTGSLKGDKEKNLLVDFTQVKLESFLPDIDSLALKGIFSGSLDFVQKDGVYKPEALVIIKNFEINNFKQGDLALNIVGDNSYEKYNVDLSLKSKKVKSIAANGTLNFTTKRPLINLKVFLEDFSLNAFSPLGKNVLSSIRGKASGAIDLTGFVGNPEMQGVLRLKNAGVLFPYLNVDYDFDGESIITLKGQSFNLENVNLLDTKYGTKGFLQ
jgi:hypothetical protein